MTIQEQVSQQIVTIGENSLKVYEAGKAAGGYNIGYTDGKKDGIAIGITEGIEKGSKRTLYGAYILKMEVPFDDALSKYHFIEDFTGKGVYAHFFDFAELKYKYLPVGELDWRFDTEGWEYWGVYIWSEDKKYNLNRADFEFSWGSVDPNESSEGFVDNQARIIVFTEPLVVTQDVYDAFTSITDNGTQSFAIVDATATPNDIIKGKTAYAQVSSEYVGWGKIEGKAKTYDEGVEQGAVNEKKRWWSLYQNNGKSTDCANMFSGRGWTNETFAPEYDITSTNNYMLFRYAGIKDLEATLNAVGRKIYIDNGNLTMTFNNTQMRKIGGVVFNVPITALSQTFAYSSYLEEIICELPVTETTSFSGAFDGCNALKQVRFNGIIGQNGLNFQWSKNLLKDSIINIMEQLSDNTSGLSVTFSQDSLNLKYMFEDGIKRFVDSNLWKNLVAAKPNWTINLV